MELIFTRSTGRFRRGDVRDYPAGTWKTIAKSAGRPLESFTSPVADKAREAVTAKKGR